MYILSGAIPPQAVIHRRTLTFFNSICRLDESSIEKMLARRQLSVKSYLGKSLLVKRFCVRYTVSDPYSIADCPPSKFLWKIMVRNAVNTYQENALKERVALYSAVDFLYVDNFWLGSHECWECD